MAATSTPGWVRFLRCYGPIPTNDNMYDETIQRALRRHKIRPLALPAQYKEELLENFRRSSPASYILTGTAGDGKTYHCREVWRELGGSEDAWNKGQKVQSLPLQNGAECIFVKDLSELRLEEGIQLVAAMAGDIATSSRLRVYLVAANHGQLLDKLKAALPSEHVFQLITIVEELMVSGRPAGPSEVLELRDLSRSPASDLIDKVITAVTEHEGWSACDVCPNGSAGAACPIRENRDRLMGVRDGGLFKERLKALVELSEHNGYHFPIRQLLVLVTNILLGHPDARDGLMSCSDVAGLLLRGAADQASIYRNVFGENLRPGRAERTEPFAKLALFGIGSETSNAIDNVLVYGADDPKLQDANAEWMLADPVYGATIAYSQAQRAYLEGREAGSEERFLSLLRAQRQRLFFTMSADQAQTHSIWDLTIFKFAGDFLRVSKAIQSSHSAPREILPLLVRGLNRVFSGMLVQNQDELILATSGSHSQTRTSPLLEEVVSVPRKGGEEVLLTSSDRGAFSIVVRLSRDSIPEPVSLRLTPTRFEFLRRVAEGALPSSFSLECHEDFLAFKARLLSAAQERRRLDEDEADVSEDLVLQFLELNIDGRASSRRVAVKI